MPVDTVRKLVGRLQTAGDRHEARNRPSGFGFATAERLDWLNARDWDHATSAASALLQRPYLGAVEASAPEGVRPRYALVYDGAEPVAAVVAQIVTIHGERFVPNDAPEDDEPLAEAVGRQVRDALLESVNETVLVCGNLLTGRPHGAAFAPGVDPEAAWPGVVEALYRLRRVEKLGGEPAFVLVKDVPTADEVAAAALRTFSYRPIETDPDMVLHFAPEWATFEDYLGAKRSKYRKSAKQLLKAFRKAPHRAERVADLAPLQDALHRLYLNVVERADARPITLRPTYWAAVADALGTEGFRCTVLFAEDAPVGFVTTLKDGDTAVAHYVGVDYAHRAPVYLRLLLAAVEDAFDLGCRRVAFGRTALEPKARLGAMPEPIQVWGRHRVAALNVVVRSLFPLVEPGEAPDRSPFKEDEG